MAWSDRPSCSIFSLIQGARLAYKNDFAYSDWTGISFILIDDDRMGWLCTKVSGSNLLLSFMYSPAVASATIFRYTRYGWQVLVLESSWCDLV